MVPNTNDALEIKQSQLLSVCGLCQHSVGCIICHWVATIDPHHHEIHFSLL